MLLVLVAAALTIIVSRRLHNGHKSSDQTRTFQVQGIIRSVDLANKSIRISHQEIPDYMPAMTMPFTFKDRMMFKDLAAGENVQFELVVTADDSWIAHIERIRSDSPADDAVGASTATSDVEHIRPGELVPDFGLTDQDGRSVRLKDFRGKAVLLTFIYTRCPLPNFCPLMTKKFAELEQRLNKEFPGKYQLLSITLDPEFDRPEVLKEYAARYDADLKDWRFATGTAASIRFVADLMGLYYANENGLISHDLRTALIGPDGRLVHLWKSNVWTPYEVQRRVRETLTGSADLAVR
jgi:protein SCO1/2